MLLYPILSERGDLNSDLMFSNSERLSPQDKLRASLNEHIYDLLAPEITDHIIAMTVRKLSKGVNDEELIKYQNQLFDKYIVTNQLTNYRKDPRFNPSPTIYSNNLY